VRGSLNKLNSAAVAPLVAVKYERRRRSATLEGGGSEGSEVAAQREGSGAPKEAQLKTSRRAKLLPPLACSMEAGRLVKWPKQTLPHGSDLLLDISENRKGRHEKTSESTAELKMLTAKMVARGSDSPKRF